MQYDRNKTRCQILIEMIIIAAFHRNQHVFNKL